MKTRNLILLLILSFVAGLLVYPVLRPCNEIVTSDTVIVETVIRDTIYQNVPQVVTETVVNYDTIYTTIFEPIPIPTDTTMIVEQFNTLRTFSDTLVDNDSVYIHLYEKVLYNRPFGRVLTYDIRSKNTTITNTINPTGFYFGGSVGYYDKIHPQINAAYLRNKNIYLLGLGTESISLGYLRRF